MVALHLHGSIPPPSPAQLSPVQSLSRVQLFATPWTAAGQASLSITDSPSLLRLMSIESVMPSSHLILCVPFSSCPQSFPASGSFQMSQLFASGGPRTGASASASVLPQTSPSSFRPHIQVETHKLNRPLSGQHLGRQD